ncbi:hypothetical protein V1524DRAFT_406159 [Lipomyces starkeyi]
MSIYYGEETSRPRARPLVTPAIAMTRGQSTRVSESSKRRHKRQTKLRTSGGFASVLQETMLKEMATADDEEASYERALNFLADNEPERRFDIRLPYRSYQALEEQTHTLYGDTKYRRVEYDGSGSRVTIYTAPSSLHAGSSEALQLGIMYSVPDELIMLNEQHLLSHILINELPQSHTPRGDDRDKRGCGIRNNQPAK